MITFTFDINVNHANHQISYATFEPIHNLSISLNLMMPMWLQGVANFEEILKKPWIA